MYSLRRKAASGNLILETRLVLKEMRSFEKSDAKWNQGSGALRARPVRLNFQLVKMKGLRYFLLPQSMQGKRIGRIFLQGLRRAVRVRLMAGGPCMESQGGHCMKI